MLVGPSVGDKNLTKNAKTILNCFLLVVQKYVHEKSIPNTICSFKIDIISLITSSVEIHIQISSLNYSADLPVDNWTVDRCLIWWQ